MKTSFMLIGLLLSTSVLAQTIWYVTPDASGTGDGTSWKNASANLQAIIDACDALDQVWVAKGRYKPTVTRARTVSFRMKNRVAIYGGFIGNETSLSQRPIISLSQPSSTTLSGDIGLVGDESDNSYHVIYNPETANINASAILDGFYITGGNANDASEPHNRGGGIYNEASSPQIRNCYFTKNAATYGGAIFNKNSNASQINCIFKSNTAVATGGAIANSSFGEDLTQTLTNCAFQSNSALNGGGAISNSAALASVIKLTLTNCTFYDNNGRGLGGAFYQFGTPSSNPLGHDGICRLVLRNSILFGNGDPYFNFFNGFLSADYSLVDVGTSDFSSGTGNIITNKSPFAGAGNPALATNTPAIDAGDPATDISSVGLIDLAGNPRLINKRIDMGAFEFQGVPEIYTLKNGNWTDTTVWSAGRVPMAGEKVYIKHKVLIPANYKASVGEVVYDPTSALVLETGSSIRLSN